ncbi:hypothetical protein NX059_006645 [Plenodomus lindquistii]|nr:hypothetical protein NX059_006645 [Plenodomus lindquistii]
MVVDPNAPIPDTQNPYDHGEGDEERYDDDTPEITINAATQVRGHGNIISIAQMDTVRIANLIAAMLNSESTPSLPLPPSPLDKLADVAAAARPQPTATPASPTPSTSSSSTPHQQTSQIHIKPNRELRRINITVNCGATVIGDRNIVGPGLGDIARQMQVAQRNQALQAQQHAAQQAADGGAKTSLPGAGLGGAGLGAMGLAAQQRRETLYQAHAAMAQRHGMMYQAQVHTPPMSRSSSEKSDDVGGGLGAGAGKRKRSVEDGVCEFGVRRKF